MDRDIPPLSSWNGPPLPGTVPWWTQVTGRIAFRRTLQEREDGLKRNCLDSIAHALAHFSANHSDDCGFHNQKWAILSVAHATEASCNLLLLALDHGHPNQMKYPGW